MTERGRVVADKKSEKKGSVWYIFNLIERSRVGTIAAKAGIRKPRAKNLSTIAPTFPLLRAMPYAAGSARAIVTSSDIVVTIRELISPRPSFTVFHASTKLLNEKEVGKAKGVSKIAMLSLKAEINTK